MSWVWVCIGGGVGATLRWWMSSEITSTSFPYGTLAVNLVGCLLIGVASAMLVSQPKMALLVITGFLGGFTTFSSFGIDAMHLLQAASYKQFLSYVLASNVFGILLVIVGHKIGTQITI